MEPTCSKTIVHSVTEAHVIMYAVAQGIRPLIKRRPRDEGERSTIKSGSVFVWEEGSGIERWTDRREWGDSRSREDFLFYTEGARSTTRNHSDALMIQDTPSVSSRSKDPLIKQTYTAVIHRPEGERKWHLIAYYTEGTKHALRTVSDDPALATLEVPTGTFRQARLPKSRRLRERPGSFSGGSGESSGRSRRRSWSPDKPHPQAAARHSPAPSSSSDSSSEPHAPPAPPAPGFALQPPPARQRPAYDLVARDGWHDPEAERPRSTLNHLGPRPAAMNTVPVASVSSRSTLPPLAYLDNLPRRTRRHPLDEMALMALMCASTS